MIYCDIVYRHYQDRAVRKAISHMLISQVDISGLSSQLFVKIYYLKHYNERFFTINAMIISLYSGFGSQF